MSNEKKEQKPYLIKGMIAAIQHCVDAGVQLHQDRMLILLAEEEITTQGGVVLITNDKEKPRLGAVVCIGPGFSDEKMLVKRVGQLVMFGKFGGTDTKVGDLTLLQLRDSDVFFVLGDHMADYVEVDEEDGSTTDVIIVPQFTITHTRDEKEGPLQFAFASGCTGAQVYTKLEIDPLTKHIELRVVGEEEGIVINAAEEPLNLEDEYIAEIKEGAARSVVEIVPMVCFYLNGREQPHVAKTTGANVYKVLGVDPEKDDVFIVKGAANDGTDSVVPNNDEELYLWRGIQKSLIEVYVVRKQINNG